MSIDIDHSELEAKRRESMFVAHSTWSPMALTKPVILLYSGKGGISQLIRFQTRSEYSHASLLFPDGAVIESWQGSAKKLFRNSGVREVHLTSTEGITAFSLPGLTQEDAIKLRALAMGKVGCDYDYLSVFRFVSRVRPHENDKWFCSELVCYLLLKVHFQILNLAPARTSPGHIAWSPNIQKIRKK